MSGSTANHPVWHVYDEYRTARLNVKCYGALLQKKQRLNLTMEVVLAVSAPTSAVAGLAFWHTTIGAWLWPVLASIAAVLAVLRPLLKLTEELQDLEKALAGYRALDHDFGCLTITIRERGNYDKTLKKRFRELLDKKASLIVGSRNVGRVPPGIEAEVTRELPTHSFYIPQEV